MISFEDIDLARAARAAKEVIKGKGKRGRKRKRQMSQSQRQRRQSQKQKWRVLRKRL